jgi:hypothetical protein
MKGRRFAWNERMTLNYSPWKICFISRNYSEVEIFPRKRILIINIADARQIFHKNFFLFFTRKTSPGSEKKNFILKNLTGDCNIPMANKHFPVKFIVIHAGITCALIT